MKQHGSHLFFKMLEREQKKKISTAFSFLYSIQQACYIPSHFTPLKPLKGNTMHIHASQSIFKQDNLVTLSSQLILHFWASAAELQQASSP